MASYLCLKSSDRPPTQGPHHYSEINSNVNLPKVLLYKALTALFSSKLTAIYAFYTTCVCVVISNLTVYTRQPTARGFWARLDGGRHSLGGGYLTSAHPNKLALIVRGSSV